MGTKIEAESDGDAAGRDIVHQDQHVAVHIDVKGNWLYGNGTVNVNSIAEVPEGNPNRRDCPQCESVTWAATEYCRRCGYNLFAHDAKLRRKRVARRKVKFFVGFAAAAASGVMAANFVPDSLRLWFYGFSALSGMLAMGSVQD